MCGCFIGPSTGKGAEKMTEERQWVFCPCCGAKTRLQLVRQTELHLFPLFCPKCRKETMINARQFRVSVAGTRETG